jgi:putative exosortase-associated protein (TIGR04073 family)
MRGGVLWSMVPEVRAMKMKSALMTALTAAGVLLLAGTALADIQDPPGNDYGPTRKLGRGLGNVMFGASELFVQPSRVNYYEGNSAAFSYGVVRGVGRFFVRLGSGLWETVSFPFATHRGTYKPPYRSAVPWIHGGYEEFPPELGFETHYRYCRSYESGW